MLVAIWIVGFVLYLAYVVVEAANDSALQDTLASVQSNNKGLLVLIWVVAVIMVALWPITLPIDITRRLMRRRKINQLARSLRRK